MQIFIVGPPRSGTTIVAQMLNTHPRIKIFDEVDFIDIGDFGPNIVAKLRAFLMERDIYEAYRAHAEQTGDCAGAMDAAMATLVGPEAIWGEKNPMYATRLEALRRAFPGALILYVLRDPRAVVNSYLTHRASPSRSHADFWIKNTVSEALALAETCLRPLREQPDAVSLLRYEDFIEGPKAALDAALRRWDVELPDAEPATAFDAPETYGDQQFVRRGAVLPWKSGNLSPLRRTAPAPDRLDPADPAWRAVDALAERFGYV